MIKQGKLRVPRFRDYYPSLLRPVSMGWETITSEDYRWNNARMKAPPNFFFIQYTLSGHGYFEAGSRTWRLEPDQAFLARMTRPYYYYFKKDAAAWEFIWVGFKGAAGEAIAQEIQESFGPVLNLPAGNLTRQMMFDLLQKSQSAAWTDLYQASAASYVFLLQLVQDLRRQAPPRLEDAVRYMEQHLAEPIDVTRLAPRFGYSREHFTRVFRQATGSSPGRYLKQLRLQKAKELVRGGRNPLQAVARLAGLHDANYLCRCFKAEFGVTPRQYSRSPEADRH